jgi:hypothetical protein
MTELTVIRNRFDAYKASMVGDPGYAGFDTPLLRNINMTGADAEHRSITFWFRVEDYMCNID